MNLFELIAERKILEALEHGDFANLSGSGKPLRWEDETHIPIDNRMVFDLLKKNGFSLPWIEEAREIEDQMVEFRRSLESAVLADSSDPYVRTMQHLEQQMQKLNKRILNYNITVPLERFQIRTLQLEREVERIKSANSIPAKDW